MIDDVVLGTIGARLNTFGRCGWSLFQYQFIEWVERSTENTVSANATRWIARNKCRRCDVVVRSNVSGDRNIHALSPMPNDIDYGD